MTSYELTTQAALFLAAEEEVRGPEFGKASPIGLLVVVLLLIAVFLLIRSMNARLRNLPESFDQEHPEPDQEFDDGTDTVVIDTAEAAADDFAGELDADAETAQVARDRRGRSDGDGDGADSGGPPTA